jgi:hypothetical protein
MEFLDPNSLDNPPMQADPALFPDYRLGNPGQLGAQPTGVYRFADRVGKEQFHNTMADFDHRKDANRADMIGLNPSDPQYTQKLAALQAQHGALTTEKAKFQMLHPWGGPEPEPGTGQMEMRPKTGSASGPSPFDQEQAPDMAGKMPSSSMPDVGSAPMQVPQYGGPGKPVEQGQMIPQKQLPQDEFKYQQGVLHDKAVAAESDPDKWAEAKGEVARNKMDNPWGSPGNHPGMLGKIGHDIGNFMGAFSPQAELQAEERGSRAAETHEAEMASKGAAAKQKEAQASLDEMVPYGPPINGVQQYVPKKDIAKLEQQEMKNTGALGTQEKKNEGALDVADARANAAKQNERLDQQYQEAIASGDHEKAERILQVKSDLAKAGQAPQRAPQTLIVEPGGRVETAKPGTTLPEGSQTLSGFATEGRPTAQTKGMSEMAQSVLKQVPNILSEVDKLKDKIGPGEGRWNEFWVNKAGVDDPDFAGLDTDLDLFASALVRTHFGARGGQQYREALRKQFAEAQSPEDLKSRIQHAETWIQGYANAGKPDGGQTPPPVSGGPSMSVADWLKSRQQKAAPGAP